jgi:hypothetical protein
MRFAVSIVCAAAIGALSVTAVRMLSSQTSMFQSVRALGGDVSQIRLADLNPRKAYDDVMEKIRSGSIARSIEFNSPTPNVTFPHATSWSPPQWNFKSAPAFQNTFGSGMNARIHPAWHGFPPR